jgi:hypothetical protein
LKCGTRKWGPGPVLPPQPWITTTTTTKRGILVSEKTSYYARRRKGIMHGWLL